jgi:hypothetical protein
MAEPGVFSPDRSLFAYDEQKKLMPSKVHLIETATGKERAVWPSANQGATLGWDATGIYQMAQPVVGGIEHPGPEIWFLDPATGERRMVAGQPKWGTGVEVFKAGVAFGGGAAWSLSGPLVRVDVKDGHPETWADYGHGSLVMLGWDTGGHPLVWLARGAVVWLVGPRREEPVEADGFKPSWGMSAPSATDKHGTWVAGDDASIWLLDSRSRMRKVAQAPLPPMPSQNPGPITLMSNAPPTRPRLLVAGPCAD